MIPIMTAGEELPQVILDSKAKHAFGWKSATLLYDNTFDRDMISRCVIALSREFPDINARVKPLSVTVFKIREMSHEWDRRKHIRSTLTNLPVEFIGRNFLVLVTTKLMQQIIEIARDLKMVDVFSQWLYVVSDTNFLHNNISSVQDLIEDGNNIAFIYNFTRSEEGCRVSLISFPETCEISIDLSSSGRSFMSRQRTTQIFRSWSIKNDQRRDGSLWSDFR